MIFVLTSLISLSNFITLDRKRNLQKPSILPSSNLAGAVFMLPSMFTSEFLPNQRIHLCQNDGKTPGLCFVSLVFSLSSVLKIGKKCADFNTKSTNRPSLEVDHCFCKVQNSLPFIITGSSIVLEIAAALLFISVTNLANFGAHFVETQARF